MVNGNLLALLIYIMCEPKWSDDIEISTKINIEDKKLKV